MWVELVMNRCLTLYNVFVLVIIMFCYKGLNTFNGVPQSVYNRPPTNVNIHAIGAIVSVADRHHTKTYNKQIATQRCVANRSGLDFVVLDPFLYVECKKYKDFFFKKHCAVSYFLQRQRNDFIVFAFNFSIIFIENIYMRI